MNSPISSWFTRSMDIPTSWRREARTTTTSASSFVNWWSFTTLGVSPLPTSILMSRRAILTTICMWIGPWSLMPNPVHGVDVLAAPDGVQVLVGVHSGQHLLKHRVVPGGEPDHLRRGEAARCRTGPAPEVPGRAWGSPPPPGRPGWESHWAAFCSPPHCGRPAGRL